MHNIPPEVDLPIVRFLSIRGTNPGSRYLEPIQISLITVYQTNSSHSVGPGV